MLRVEFEEENGITVPYPPLHDKIRNNHGFVDLRGQPDLAEKVFEGSQSIALKKLLIRLAEQPSPFFTLGCDLGSHEEDGFEPESRRVAGGYIQIISTDYAERLPNDYLSLAYAIEKEMEPFAENHHWMMRFVHMPVRFNLDNFNNDISSLWIWFYACASSPTLALESREKNIESLHKVLLQFK